MRSTGLPSGAFVSVDVKAFDYSKLPIYTDDFRMPSPEATAKILAQNNQLYGRRMGKTRSAIELAKLCRGIVLTINNQHARQIEKEHNVTAAGIYDAEGLSRGIERPFIIDQDAALLLMNDLSVKIDRFERLVPALKKLCDTADNPDSRFWEAVYELHDTARRARIIDSDLPKAYSKHEEERDLSDWEQTPGLEVEEA